MPDVILPVLSYTASPKPIDLSMWAQRMDCPKFSFVPQIAGFIRAKLAAIKMVHVASVRADISGAIAITSALVMAAI